jgi:hypothetical protein
MLSSRFTSPQAVSILSQVGSAILSQIGSGQFWKEGCLPRTSEGRCLFCAKKSEVDAEHSGIWVEEATAKSLTQFSFFFPPVFEFVENLAGQG